MTKKKAPPIFEVDAYEVFKIEEYRAAWSEKNLDLKQDMNKFNPWSEEKAMRSKKYSNSDTMIDHSNNFPAHLRQYPRILDILMNAIQSCSVHSDLVVDTIALQ